MPDFDALARVLLSRAGELLPRWLPGGTLRGQEYSCGNLRGDPGDSLKVNIQTGKWADFASNEKGGDLTSLYAAIEGVSQGEAAKRLAEEFAIPSSAPTPTKKIDHVIVDPPAGAPVPEMAHFTLGRPSMSWCYRNPDGSPKFYVARYESREGKQVLPWSWSQTTGRWVTKAFPAPRPLYGLELLAARPDAPVLLVEGEKACDAARKLVGDRYVVVTWPGGAPGAGKADFSPLRDKHVLACPDADDPGIAVIHRIADKIHRGTKEFKILDVQGQPAGWDLADAVAGGWTWEQFYAWAKPRVFVFGHRPPISEVKEPDQTINCTDLGNARRFVARHGDKVRYCYSWDRWLVWNGLLWARDENGEAHRLAKETINAIIQEAVLASDFKLREELIRHALKSEAAGRITSMLKLAESELPIPVLESTLDTRRWLMGVKNGTLDLQTGKLVPPRREDFITRCAGVPYDPDAKCPTWDAFLARILGGNEHLLTFLHRAIGYSLTAETREQCLFFLHGSGANGKSTFLETVRHVMGDYATQMSMDSLAIKKNRDGSANTPDIARLHRARFVAAVESDENMRFSEGLVKQLTGDDKITACRKYEEPFEFHPSHKLFIGTNHKPVIRGTDYAIWRRIRLIPFEVTIPPEERDRSLPEKLQAEAPGILAWAVRGCLDWQKHGLGLPKEVSDATEEYRNEMDALAGFLAEKCTLLPGDAGRVRAHDLYEAYKEWCKDTGEFQLTQTRFGRKLVEKGFKREQSNGMWYRGIVLVGQKEEIAF